MKGLYFLLIGFVFLSSFSAIVPAQSEYSVPACGDTKSQKFVGERLRLPVPKDAKLKKVFDSDYENYFIGFGEKKNRVWLSGIFG